MRPRWGKIKHVDGTRRPVRHWLIRDYDQGLYLRDSKGRLIHYTKDGADRILRRLNGGDNAR